MARTKIIIVEDQTLFATLLRESLENQYGKQVLAIAADGKEAINLATKTEFDLMLVDIALPKVDGIAVCEKVLEAKPDSKLIALSGEYDNWTIIRVASAGFLGFIDKHETEISAINDIIDDVLAGKHGYSKAYQNMRDAVFSDVNAPHKVLSNRLLALMPLFGQGYSDGKIAEMMGLAVSTIATNRQSARERLGLNSTRELIAYAIENGFYKRKPKLPSSAS